MIVFTVSVKTVAIEAAEAAVVSGAEDAQLTVTCRAVGGPPVPEISWRLPEALTFDTEEEVLHRVMDISNNPFLICNINIKHHELKYLLVVFFN